MCIIAQNLLVSRAKLFGSLRFCQNFTHAVKHPRAKLNNWSLGTQKTNKSIIDGVSTAFHVYKIEWSKDYIQFFVDDKLYYTSPNEGKGTDYYPFTAPQHLLLNVAVGGNLGGPTINDAIFPCRMEVDYVRVYQ